MVMDARTQQTVKMEVESILKRDQKFGSLHRVETTESNELILIWDNAALRPKSKSSPGPYLEFMERIADCLADYGCCLAADDEASESDHNHYLFIIEDDEDGDFED